MVPMADPGRGGGVIRGVNLFVICFACSYMKIPADLDPNPPH